MMRHKILLLFLTVFLVSFVTAELPTCSDTNEIDISDIPCVALTININCSNNVSIFNSSDPSINTSANTTIFVGGVRNFTVNLSRGGYEFIDCENNTATVIVGLFQQGYGITLFGIMFPSILLTMVSLFVSGHMFHKFRDDDEENHEQLEREDDSDSFMPKSRLMPIIFMLFAFIPMIFMVGFVNAHLEEYLPTLNMTSFYGFFYVLFSSVFYFVFLVSILVWLGSFIKMRRVMKGLDDID